MTLREFTNKYLHTKVDDDRAFGNQCWDLVSRYLREVLDCPSFPTRVGGPGNVLEAFQNFLHPLPNYLVKIQNNPRDLFQVPSPGDIIFWGYVHTAIVLEAKPGGKTVRVLQQNAPVGAGVMISDMSYDRCVGWFAPLRRPAAAPTPPPPAPAVVQPAGSQVLHLPAAAQSWRVYPLDRPATVGNESGRLAPARFGGLTYDILGWAAPNTAIIQTRDFGRVKIWVAPDTQAVITSKPAAAPTPPPPAPAVAQAAPVVPQVQQQKVSQAITAPVQPAPAPAPQPQPAAAPAPAKPQHQNRLLLEIAAFGTAAAGVVAFVVQNLEVFLGILSTVSGIVGVVSRMLRK